MQTLLSSGTARTRRVKRKDSHFFPLLWFMFVCVLFT
jgi:hypothetical protein